MALTYKDIAEIIRIIDASDCEELVVELEGARLEVRRHGAGGPARAAYSDGAAKAEGTAEAFESGAADAPETAPNAVPASGALADAGARANGRVEVRAPMVGTFYRAPSPQDPPFVEIGARVSPGDALCLIEVMKLYTTIEAEISGRVVDIAAEDAAAVEAGQVLFVIDPA